MRPMGEVDSGPCFAFIIGVVFPLGTVLLSNPFVSSGSRVMSHLIQVTQDLYIPSCLFQAPRQARQGFV
jgi:hypothetical protein